MLWRQPMPIKAKKKKKKGKFKIVFKINECRNNNRGIGPEKV